MQVIDTIFDEVKIFEPRVFTDDRGYFCETFREEILTKAIGRKVEFVQDNESLSRANVARGMHWQLPPMAQEKLVRCVRGAVWDVVVDIRKSSPTFGRWFGAVISEENRRQIFIPAGFAHGFLSLEENSLVLYKSSNVWCPQLERSFRFDDEDVAIEWPAECGRFVVSAKDKAAPKLTDAEVFE